MEKYLQELEVLRHKALQEDTMPDDKLADRYGEKWESQYPDALKFQESFGAIKGYSSYQHPQNGWNENMVKTHNAIYNFDTIIEKDGYSHEIVSLVVTKQKLEGRYSAADPAAKFHDWVGSKHPAPETVEQIDARLLEIVGNADFVRFADDVAAKFNILAEHGNVPEELFDQDPKYWNVVINIFACQYAKNCDSNQLKEMLESRAHEQDAGSIPDVVSEWISLFLPDADALDLTPHFSIVYGEPWICTYGNCQVATYGLYSIGEHNITAQPPYVEGHEGIGHGTSNNMDFRVSTCSNSNGYNVVHAVVTVGLSEVYNSYLADTECTVIETTIEASDRTNPWYVWRVDGTTNSWQLP